MGYPTLFPVAHKGTGLSLAVGSILLREAIPEPTRDPWGPDQRGADTTRGVVVRSDFRDRVDDGGKAISFSAAVTPIGGQAFGRGGAQDVYGGDRRFAMVPARLPTEGQAFGLRGSDPDWGDGLWVVPGTEGHGQRDRLLVGGSPGTSSVGADSLRRSPVADRGTGLWSAH